MPICCDRKRRIRLTWIAACFLAALFTSIDTTARAQDAPDASSITRFVFWDEEDVRNVVGSKLMFDALPLEPLGTATGYPERLQYACAVPRKDGGRWIYGWRLVGWQEKQTRGVEVVRCNTKDGVHFENSETVFREINPQWQGFVNIVHRPADDGRAEKLFLFSFADARLCVYTSSDGAQWKLLTDNAYKDHDACCIIWHAPSRALVNYQHTLQKWPQKRYPDNIGAYRRVMSFRRSVDGVKWESFSPAFLHGGLLWTPDADDPVDLEFYRPVVFPHAGGWAMLLLDYIAPPPEANSRRATTRHGPRSQAEWAHSRDGLNWKRTRRGLDATKQIGFVPVQGPLEFDGIQRFYGPDGQMAGLPDDRIFYVTCAGNGEFSTPAFSMPANGLLLNADVRYQPQEELGRAYVMVEVQDAQGKVLPGFERAMCLLENVDGRALPLKWDGADANTLAGKTVQLRFYLREAKIFGVTAASMRP